MNSPACDDIILTDVVARLAATPPGGVRRGLVGGDASEHGGTFSMVKMSMEIQGSVDEVIGVLMRLGAAGRPATVIDADRSNGKPADGVREPMAASSTPSTMVADGAAPGEWTEPLAREFLAGLQPAARQMALHVWRAGGAGIHRSVLCQRAEVTPMELGSLLMRMGHALRRFQRQRGMTLTRPVAGNSPLQSYFVDADFAAAANAQMFGNELANQLADDPGRRST